MTKNINQKIADRVRELRKQSALNLEQLAAKTGVSRSMLSQIERGESSPTAVLLEKVATGLGVTLASLFETNVSQPKPISHAADRKRWKDPESGYSRRNISPPNFPSPIQIIEVELPAKAHVAFETSTREPVVHQQIWLKKGHIRVGFGKEQFNLVNGDCLAMRLDQPTTFTNLEDTTAKYLVVIAR